jgi:hypothetical protein
MNGLRNFSEFEPAQDPSQNCAKTQQYTRNAGGTSFKDGMQGTQQLRAIHEIAPGVFLHPDKRQPIRFAHELQDLPIERETNERSDDGVSAASVDQSWRPWARMPAPGKLELAG